MESVKTFYSPKATLTASTIATLFIMLDCKWIDCSGNKSSRFYTQHLKLIDEIGLTRAPDVIKALGCSHFRDSMDRCFCLLLIRYSVSDSPFRWRTSQGLLAAISSQWFLSTSKCWLICCLFLPLASTSRHLFNVSTKFSINSPRRQWDVTGHNRPESCSANDESDAIYQNSNCHSPRNTRRVEKVKCFVNPTKKLIENSDDHQTGYN